MEKICRVTRLRAAFSACVPGWGRLSEVFRKSRRELDDFRSRRCLLGPDLPEAVRMESRFRTFLAENPVFGLGFRKISESRPQLQLFLSLSVWIQLQAVDDVAIGFLFRKLRVRIVVSDEGRVVQHASGGISQKLSLESDIFFLN